MMITKVRDKELEKYLQTQNIYLTDKFTKKAKFLIVPSKDISSSKVNKAISAGIPLVTIDEIKETSGFNNN